MQEEILVNFFVGGITGLFTLLVVWVFSKFFGSTKNKSEIGTGNSSAVDQARNSNNNWVTGVIAILVLGMIAVIPFLE